MIKLVSLALEQVKSWLPPFLESLGSFEFETVDEQVLACSFASFDCSAGGGPFIEFFEDCWYILRNFLSLGCIDSYLSAVLDAVELIGLVVRVDGPVGVVVLAGSELAICEFSILLLLLLADSFA